MTENVLEVSKILNISNTEINKFLEFCEKNITDKILDRCNIETIPERLNALIQEFLIEQYNLNKEGIGKGIKQVTNASDNGQSVNFQIIGGVNSMAKNAEEFLDRNMTTLISYRKMRR